MVLVADSEEVCLAWVEVEAWARSEALAADIRLAVAQAEGSDFV